MSEQLFGAIQRCDQTYGTITVHKILIGVLSEDQSKQEPLHGILTWDKYPKLLGALSLEEKPIGWLNVSNAYDIYSGPYQVTPKASESQVLKTSSYLMGEDVTVLEVPYYEVGNTSDGTTVYIAEGVTENGL